MKMISKVMVVLGLAVALVGCGSDDYGSAMKGNWSEDASAYVNQNVAPLKGVKGKVYQFDIREIKTSGEIALAVQVYVDGEVKDVFALSRAGKLNGFNMANYQNVVVRWTEDGGFMVDSGYSPNSKSLPPLIAYIRGLEIRRSQIATRN